MNNRKIPFIFAISSIALACFSILYFFITKGPEANVLLLVKVVTILSIIGCLFAIGSCIFSWRSARRSIYILISIIGLISNSVLLVAAYLLLLAVGIGGV